MRIKRVDYSRKFEKDLRKAPRKIQTAFRNRLELLLNDKFNPILNNHSLVGKYKNYRSINITGDWRAIYKEYRSGGTIYFSALGTHNKLYN